MNIKKLSVAIVFSLMLVASVIHFSSYEDSSIPLHPGKWEELAVLFAKDLVIQGQDDRGNIWATRGFWAYRKRSNEHVFYRQYRIPSGLNISLLGNIKFIRWLTNRDVWVELLPFHDGTAIAIAGNSVWHRSPDGSFKRTFRLKYPLRGVGGVGVGTGFLPSALLLAKDRRVYFGEYYRNEELGDVNIYASSDLGQIWHNVYRFQHGSIRHIHGIQQDPFTEKIWISTGDIGSQVKIVNTNDFSSFSTLGEGSQKFRSIGLAFDHGYVYWGTDTEYDHTNSGIYRMEKETLKAEKISEISGCIYMTTKLTNGVIAFSEARQGARIEPDDLTSLYLIKNGTQITKIHLGHWKKNPVFRNFAWARFARGDNLDSLYFTVLNSQPSNGMLFVIPQHLLN